MIHGTPCLALELDTPCYGHKQVGKNRKVTFWYSCKAPT